MGGEQPGEVEDPKMKKRVWICLAVLGSIVQACGWYPLDDRREAKESSYLHISGLALYDGGIYFGGGYCLYRLDIADQSVDAINCSENWTFQRPAVDGERAYAQVLTQPEEERIFTALDLSTGEIVWRVDERSRYAYFKNVRQFTVLWDALIFTARKDGILAYDSSSGDQIWSTEHTWMLADLPFLLYNGLLWYVVRSEQDDRTGGILVAVEPSSGEIQETIDLSPMVTFDELLLLNERWIIGLDFPDYTATGRVFAVNRSRPDEVAWAKELVLPTGADQVIELDDRLMLVSSGKVYALDTNTGEVFWEFDIRTGRYYPDKRYRAETSPQETVVFIPYSGGDSQVILTALEPRSGTLMWEYDLVQYPLGGPIVNDGAVYVANGDSVDALDLKTGQLLWQVPIDSQVKIIVDRSP
jgi:outer membrane protein assembly factor BamB